MAVVPSIAKQPIPFSVTEATGGQGGIVAGYNVVFTEDDDPTWIEKTIFDAFFTPIASAEGLSFGSAIELVKLTSPVAVERPHFHNTKRLTGIFSADESSVAHGGKTPITKLVSVKEYNAETPRHSNFAKVTLSDILATDWQVYVADKKKHNRI